MSVPLIGPATSTLLGGLALLHVAWGLGSSFPMTDRIELADVVAGNDRVPGAPASFAVAGLLGVAAGLVAGDAPARVRRVGVVGVAVVLGGRGVAGLTGRTRLLVPWRPSPRFVRLDRSVYGPLCLLLAVGALTSVRN